MNLSVASHEFFLGFHGLELTEISDIGDLRDRITKLVEKVPETSRSSVELNVIVAQPQVCKLTAILLPDIHNHSGEDEYNKEMMLFAYLMVNFICFFQLLLTIFAQVMLLIMCLLNSTCYAIK